MKILALILLCACGGYANVLPDLNPPPGKDVKRILGAGALLRPDWQSSRWARPDDRVDLAMVFFVVAQDGTACIVPDAIWAVAKSGDSVKCAPWRLPR